MGMTLAVFRIARKTPVENDKLPIIPRWFDIWSWRRCKTSVGILLGTQDSLVLRDDNILQISSLVAEVDFWWQKIPYTFPSLLYIFDVFIKKVCEILFFSPFEECW